MLIQKERIPIKEILLFGFIPSFIKKILYRLRGYKIGKKVSFGFGSVLRAKEVSVGDYTRIGFLTIIRGKTIRIGSHVSIGPITFIDTPHIQIGDDSKINEQVYVGGLQFPDSRFVLGKNCQIMQMSFINPAKSVVVGDDSGIGGFSLLFGHTSWLSQFEGYSINFEPIEIGNSVSLAWRVFVLPGTKIGDGAVIGANSLVHREIPSKCMAVGFPARVVSKFPDFPKFLSEAQKIDILKNIVTEMMTFFTGSGLSCSCKENDILVRQMKRAFWVTKEKTWRLRVAYEPVYADELISTDEHVDVLISLKTIPDELREKLAAISTMWLDIEKKERPVFWNDLGEEVVLFLRRYGVRFNRVNEKV